MCTLTLVCAPDSQRLMMNRDEMRQRPEAEPPRVHAGPPPAIYPVDPPRGTWIGANTNGLSAALLNRNPGTTPAWERPPGQMSRGLIIPQVLQATSVSQALATLRQATFADYAFFTLVVLDHDNLATCTWDDHGWKEEVTSLASVTDAQAYCWTSSGLGDELVAATRLPIFADSLLKNPTAATQDTFHRDRTGPDGSRWVLMQRDDARTVSCTAIKITASTITCDYQTIPAQVTHAAESFPTTHQILQRHATAPQNGQRTKA